MFDFNECPTCGFLASAEAQGEVRCAHCGTAFTIGSPEAARPEPDPEPEAEPWRVGVEELREPVFTLADPPAREGGAAPSLRAGPGAGRAEGAPWEEAAGHLETAPEDGEPATSLDDGAAVTEVEPEPGMGPVISLDEDTAAEPDIEEPAGAEAHTISLDEPEPGVEPDMGPVISLDAAEPGIEETAEPEPEAVSLDASEPETPAAEEPESGPVFSLDEEPESGMEAPAGGPVISLDDDTAAELGIEAPAETEREAVSLDASEPEAEPVISLDEDTAAELGIEEPAEPEPEAVSPEEPEPEAEPDVGPVISLDEDTAAELGIEEPSGAESEPVSMAEPEHEPSATEEPEAGLVFSLDEEPESGMEAPAEGPVISLDDDTAAELGIEEPAETEREAVSLDASEPEASMGPVISLDEDTAAELGIEAPAETEREAVSLDEPEPEGEPHVGPVISLDEDTAAELDMEPQGTLEREEAEPVISLEDVEAPPADTGLAGEPMREVLSDLENTSVGDLALADDTPPLMEQDEGGGVSPPGDEEVGAPPSEGFQRMAPEPPAAEPPAERPVAEPSDTMPPVVEDVEGGGVSPPGDEEVGAPPSEGFQSKQPEPPLAEPPAETPAAPGPFEALRESADDAAGGMTLSGGLPPQETGPRPDAAPAEPVAEEADPFAAPQPPPDEPAADEVSAFAMPQPPPAEPPVEEPRPAAAPPEAAEAEAAEVNPFAAPQAAPPAPEPEPAAMGAPEAQAEPAAPEMPESEPEPEPVPPLNPGGKVFSDVGPAAREWNPFTGRREKPARGSSGHTIISPGTRPGSVVIKSPPRPAHIPAPDASLPMVALRGALLIFLAAGGARFILASRPHGVFGHDYLHNLHQGFNDLGHLLLGAAGPVAGALGGTFLQLGVPLLMVGGFLAWRGRFSFGASVGLWLFGTALVDLAPYMGDAKYLKLLQLNNYLSAISSAEHDWYQVFSRLGLIDQARAIATGAHLLGAAAILGGIAWGGLILYKQFQQARL